MSHRWRNGFIGTALATLAGLLFWWTPWWMPVGQRLINLSYDLSFLFRSDIATEGVTILAMDSLSDLKLHQDRRASWDRAIHARMLKRIIELHPKAVVFDVSFRDPEDPEADRQLAEAARALGKVVVGTAPEPDFYQGRFVGKRVPPPFDALRNVVTYGLVEAADPDEAIREHNHQEVLLYRIPSMACRVAQLTMTNAPDPFIHRYINHYGPPDTIRHYSYYRIFETNLFSVDYIPMEDISNKVVLVAGRADASFAGGQRADTWHTPYTATEARVQGGEVEATAYLNLIRDDWLRRLPPAQEAALLVAWGALFGFGLAGFRPTMAAYLALFGALAIAGACIWGVWRTHVLLPWMIPVVVQVPCSLGWSILAHTQKLAREKHSLEQALALASEAGPEGGREQPALAAARIGIPMPAHGAISGSAPQQSILAGQPSRPAIPDHELLRQIGRGAYGEVWLARDAIGTFHAVKIVYRSTFADAVPLEREFNGIRKFTPISRSHPGFIHILHVGRNEAAGYLFYVMELGDDQTTGQTIDPGIYSPLNLARILEKRGRLPLDECLELCIQLADALDYLHRQQLIHRDLKPSNIIFVEKVPKFADIGLVTDVATKGRDLSNLGTPGRIAPEGPGSASDIYSLGKIIYEAGMGLDLTRFPELPTELISSGDEAGLFQLNRIILKACALEAGQRYPSAAALRDDLIALRTKTRGEAGSPRGTIAD